MTKPLILVSNDDGVTAPGIQALAEVAREFGEVVVVAPNKPQSGMGHAITINDALRIEDHSSNNNAIFSTTGTPVDCIKLAVNEILDRKPDLVLSGINHGSNASINILYSGTMSAAIEGGMEGIPSIGFSLLDHSIDADFEPSKHIVRKLLEQFTNHPLKPSTCLNINIPKLGVAEIAGIRVCRQAKAYWREDFDKRTDPSGKEYYWLSGKFIDQDSGDDTDIAALRNGYVSVVPVQFDLTSHEMIETLNNTINV